MQLTFLGSGSSTGVPIIACPCAVCHSNNAFNIRTRPSILLTTDQGQNILIDTSPDLRQQALKFNITHLEAVLLTHTHADHVLGFDDLRAFNFRNKGNIIQCYAIQDTLESLKQVFNYIFFPPIHYKGGLLAQVQLNEIEHLTKFSVCSIPFAPFKLIHGQTPTTGFRFGNTAYVTDCNAIPEESKIVLKGVENIIIDGLRDKPHATHFSIEEAIHAANEFNPKQIIITHLSHSVEYHDTSKTLPSNVMLAYDGLTTEVKI